MNQAKTAVLLAAMTGLFLAIGFLIGGKGGMVVALMIALAMNFVSYWFADSIVLRLYNAQPVDDATAPDFVGLVAELANRAGLPMPKVYLIEDAQPNAFATGRNPDNAAVAATTGLLNSLSREEVAGVMAHELAHVKNRDTLIMTITATIAGAISMLANMAIFSSHDRNNPMGFVGSILLMILAPLAASLVQMAISRSREYEADRIGAQICGQPLWLASALGRIEAGAHQTVNYAAERNPATAHMFIINPLAGTGADNLFSTHPATANRIDALQRLAYEWHHGLPEPAAPRRGPWG